jgi:hypothetical protein
MVSEMERDDWFEKKWCHVPSSIEIRIVEREEVLVFVVYSLNRMRLALWEVPDIAKSKFSYLMSAFLVYS